MIIIFVFHIMHAYIYIKLYFRGNSIIFIH